MNEKICFRRIGTSKQLPLLTLLLLFSIGMMAQSTITVTGTVTGDDGQPLPGANVIVVGTSNGTTTDFDGLYELSGVDGDARLEFSYIGFENTVVNVNNRNEINITLSTDAEALDEVVLIGYGSVKKSDLTGAVTSLGTDDFNKGPQSSVEQLLQSRVAGVKITQSSAAPGGGVSVRIRGAASITSGNQPLYVIDGQPMDNDPSVIPGSAVFEESSPRNPLKALNPNDIESIQVLKDASSTAIYGARGANGVILVTTKSGRSGKMQVNYSINSGVQTAIRRTDYLDATQFANFTNDVRAERGLEPAYTAQEIAGFGQGTDWTGEILRTAMTQDHQLSFSGGNETTKYFASVNYFDQEGVLIGSGSQRFGGRLNLQHSAGKFDFGVNMTTNYLVDDFTPNGTQVNSLAGAIVSANQFTPTLPVRNPDGSFLLTTVIDLDNPVAQARTIFDQAITDRTFGNIFVNYEVANNLNAKVRFASDRQTVRRDSYIDVQTKRGLGSSGQGTIQTQERSNYVVEATLDYQKQFNDDNNLSLLGGYTYQVFDGRGQFSSAQNFPNDNFVTDNLSTGDPQTFQVGSNRFQSTLISYLGRANYSLKNKYLFTASFRADGSSKFGEGNKYGFFPSGAFAWKINEENFMSDSNTFSELKFRTSYGITGNQEIGVGRSLILLGPSSPAVFDGNLTSTIVPTQLANPNLQWETTAQFDIGIDFGLWNNRITGSMDYFVRNTSDLLLALPVSLSTGFETSLVNVGDTRNQGFEFMIDSRNVITDKFTWSTNFNFSTLRNQATSLGPSDRIIEGNVGFNFGTSIITEGEPLNSYFGYEVDGIFQNDAEVASSAQPDAKPGDIRFSDTNDDGIIDQEDRVILGTPIPTLNLGLGNTFSYEGFNLEIFFDGSFGHQVLNGSRLESEVPTEEFRNRQTYVLDRWTPENPSLTNPSFNNSVSLERAINSRIVEDADFVRLRNVVLSYDFPTLKKTWVRSLSVNVTAQNLFTLTNYSGDNPDVNSFGDSNFVADFGAYPLPRIFTIGVNIGL